MNFAALLQRSQTSGSLGSKLLGSFVESTFDARHQDYLPDKCIDRLVNKQSIEEELVYTIGIDAETRENLFRWIVSESKRLFAITVECDVQPPQHMLYTLLRFKDCRLNDSKLPVENPKDHERPIATDGAAVFHEEVWSALKLYNFYEKQWKYLAPVFSPTKYDYDLSSECILPFQVDGDTPKEGAFSNVYKVRIHPDHQKHFQFDRVAIKEIKVSRGNDKTGTNVAWELEAKALRIINKFDHPHIVKCIAAIRRGDSRYFMFPWANGDSLRDFWAQVPNPTQEPDIIQKSIIQLYGVADALMKLHDFDGAAPDDYDEKGLVRKTDIGLKVQNEVVDYADVEQKVYIRHGDLKPENILRFTTEANDLGDLKIADMGLAKRHVVATQDRTHITSTRYGTILYEAPEARIQIQRSRLYDIWSMGCIVLEFIIWILYGQEELENFYAQLKGDGQQTSQYFEVSQPGSPSKHSVHHVVRRWMDHIQEKDPECSRDSAIRDLLGLVRERLLVIPLPPRRPTTMNTGPHFSQPSEDGLTRYRATAAQFQRALKDILEKASRNPAYLSTGLARKNTKTPDANQDTYLSVSKIHLAPNAGGEVIERFEKLNLTGMTSKNSKDYAVPPLKDWEFIVDNDFAFKLLSDHGNDAFRPSETINTALCDYCKRLSFWAGGFAFEYTTTDLKERSRICALCNELHSTIEKQEIATTQKLRFERSQSMLLLASAQSIPLLSIFKTENSSSQPFQLGFPELPAAGSDLFFGVIRAWLTECDGNHIDCQPTDSSPLPTRLIDVGTPTKPQLRLLETRSDKIESEQYIALSHPWGDMAKHPPFCTLRSDPSGGERTLKNFKHSIPFDQLPATFKDAVITTRALHVRYLWIDSICIIQGPDGDFNEEANRMEDVFSGAYCVIAASRATGQTDGFLGPRPSRRYLKFQREAEKPFYICEPIDNFSQDVLDNSLNKRGWVLQERALARRTVFFTERQTYFECGSGVRCETLARMHNNLADFLGDPKFPNKAMIKSRGLKIHYFQDLYQQYTRLRFTTIEDRPIAIAGLENRLKKAFKTEGSRFGIFDDGAGGSFFHRSLLWRRGEDEEVMTPIVFHRNTKVPSWSWMAYKGGINYLDPEFETAEWEVTEIRPAWKSSTTSDTIKTDRDLHTALVATVRDFNVAYRSKSDTVQVVYDSDRRGSDGQQPQCVIVARTKKEDKREDKTYFVLIIALEYSRGAHGERIYERVGAGKMLGKYIALDGSGTQGLIC